MADKPSATIDRQATTPFLLNFCYRSAGFHSLSEFPVPTPSNPHPHLPAHLQVYTWYSCTLRELAHILTSALPGILPEPTVGTRLSFRLVFPDTRPPPPGPGPRTAGRLEEDVVGRVAARYTSREMGSVVIAPSDGGGHVNGDASAGTGAVKKFNLEGDDADKTLADVRFVIGDFVDCAVFPPLSDGSVAPRSAGGGGGLRGGPGPPPMRENGYGRVRGGSYGASGRGYGGGGRGDFGGNIPSGEWRRGERLPDSGYRGYGRGGGMSSRGRY